MWAAFDGSDHLSLWEVGSCSPATDVVKAHRSTDEYVVCEHMTGGVELFIEKRAVKEKRGAAGEIEASC